MTTKKAKKANPTNPTNPISLTDFLTKEEINKAIHLFKENAKSNSFSHSQFIKEVKEQIMEPNMDRINKAIGQENDPQYLAYLLLFAITQSVQDKQK